MANYSELAEQAIKRGNTLTGKESVADIIALAGGPTYAQTPGGALQDNRTNAFLTEEQALKGFKYPGVNLGLPSGFDAGNAFDQLYQDNLEGDFAASTLPQDRIQFIQDAENKRLEANQSLIRGDYERERTRQLEDQAAREGGLVARGAQQAGTGSGLGASTIQTAQLEIAKKESEKSLADLGKRRDEALSKADMDSWERAKIEIKDEQGRLDKIRQQEFENRMSLINIGSDIQNRAVTQRLAIERFGLDVKQFEDGQERFERTQGLAEAQFDYDMSQDDLEIMNKNLANMAAGQISLNQISEIERTQFEKAARMVPGTFEAIYSKLLNEAAQGRIMDALEVKKLQADIANTYNTIANRNADNARQNTAQQSNDIVSRLKITAGKDYYVDPAAYAQERSRANMKPGEFDLRYGYMLSPDERTNLNVYQNVMRDTSGTSNESIAE